MAFDTVWGLRSAMSYWHAWDMMVYHPGSLFLLDERLLVGPCRPTDSFSNTMLSTGMSAWLGTKQKRSFALLDRHVQCMDRWLQSRLRHEADPDFRYQFALAGFCNFFLWLGWFQSSECFSLRWEDFEVIEPQDALLTVSYTTSAL